MNKEDYFDQMVSLGASDLFVTEGLPVAVKLHGELTPLAGQALTSEQAQALVFSCMTPAQIEQFEAERECNFAVANDQGRFRISAFWQKDNVGMVARRIVTDLPQADDLGLPPQLKDAIMAKRGLILFVGGTGTGKSTSLAALIDHRNSCSKGHILTVEDLSNSFTSTRAAW